MRVNGLFRHGILLAPWAADAAVRARLRAKSKPLAVSEPVRPEQKLEKLRLVVPPGQGKQAEILGEGAAAAPKVVELMQQLGVA